MKVHVWAEKIDKVVFKIMYGVSVIAALALFAIAIISSVDSIGTAVFSSSFPNGTDWVAYLNIPVVFLAMGYIQVERGNTVVDLVSSKFPKIVEKIIKIFGYLVGTFICGYLCKCEVKLMLDKLASSTRSSSAANAFVVWPFALIIAIGYFVAMIAFFWSVLRELFIAPERRMGAFPGEARIVEEKEGK